MKLEDLEQAKGGPFVFRHEGALHVLPDPETVSPAWILRAFETDGRTLTDVRMPLHKAAALLRAWAGHYDLGTARDVRRLAYILDRYADAVEYDLRTIGDDLGTLWRARRWRLLLNLIDHLPRHSYYSDAVSNDVEHARMLADAYAEQGEDGEKPKRTMPMTQFTPEVSALADLIDAVNRNTHVLQLVNTDPKAGKKPSPPEPYLRPETALQREMKVATTRARQRKHEELVARLLPHKRKSAS